MAAKRKTKAAAAKRPSPAYEFVHAYLSKHRKATYSQVKDAAAKKRLKVYPIVYGRVQAVLGIVKMAGYGEAKKKRAAARGAGKRQAGRRGKRTTTDASLSEIVAMIQQRDSETDDLRDALEQIKAVCERALR